MPAGHSQDVAPSTLGFPGRLLFPCVTVLPFVLIGTVDGAWVEHECVIPQIDLRSEPAVGIRRNPFVHVPRALQQLRVHEPPARRSGASCEEERGLLQGEVGPSDTTPDHCCVGTAPEGA